MRGSLLSDEANATSTSTSTSISILNPSVPSPVAPDSRNPTHSGGNVFRLLARREVSSRKKHSTNRKWGEASKDHLDSFESIFEGAQDAKRSLLSWVEAESLRHLSAKYCSLQPPPRSTIAAAFSHDGKTLASTHGDHTVKIIDCQTGSCLKVLSGHRRTPWVVRFHPLCSEILASGSLDHEVRLWDANTAECIGSHDFYRPIASIAFHAHGELLAVASGHRLYVWHYNKRGEAASPTIVLRTRRSLRAVHFHPHGFPFLLTAEVNDLDSSEPSMTIATSPSYVRYPPPTVYLAEAHSAGHPSTVDEQTAVTTLPISMLPSLARDSGRTSMQQTEGDVGLDRVRARVDPSATVRLLTYSTPSGQCELLSPIEPNRSPVREESGTDFLMGEVDNSPPHTTMDTVEVQVGERNNHLFSFGDPTNWELPFIQGFLVGQRQAGQRRTSLSRENSTAHGDSEYTGSSPAIPINAGQHRVTGRSSSHHHSLRLHPVSRSASNENRAFNNLPRSDNDTQPVSRIPSELASSLAAAAAAELPCTVKLRVWSHIIRNPCAPLDGKQPRLTIPHAVLCSEMGAHFSPCGRFLAACVACVLPPLDAEPGLHAHVQNDFPGFSTSPTRHPILARQVVYELRIYSLEEATFGLVLVSRSIRAAHCLTSIQFSPTSEHLLLAYGRRHSSLLKSVVIDGDSSVPIYTILEVYRVSDMELVRCLSSAEDEVNVACFHPDVGSGLVYGTKEGKLRILQYKSSHGINCSTSSFLEENMLEVPTYALEC